ncbi:MAG: hypothetical protein ACLFO1_00550 [Spirochaetaceae bacterium]
MLTMSRIVFDAYSIEDIVPPEYDQEAFYYRYKNGAGAENPADFADMRRALEPLLREGPRTANELARALGAKPSRLIQVLDYLFAHTGEVAALEVPNRDTYYIWADAQVAQQMRTRFAVGSVHFESESISPEDLPVLTSYLTNLLVLRPSVETLDKTIDKTQRLLDAYRIKQAIEGTKDDEGRIALLREKLEQLRERRRVEWERWSTEGGGDETGGSSGREGAAAAAGTYTGTDARANVRANAATDARAGAPTNAGEGRGRRGKAAEGRGGVYPFTSLYLLGTSYNYSGPEKEKRFCWRDSALRKRSFPNLTRIFVELDTFFDDVANGMAVHEKIQELRRGLFPDHKLEIVYRRVPGLTYPKKIARRLHDETVALIERGYKVLQSPGPDSIRPTE